MRIKVEGRLIKVDNKVEFVKVMDDKYIGVEREGIEMTFGEVIDEIGMKIAKEMNEVYGPAH